LYNTSTEKTDVLPKINQQGEISKTRWSKAMENINDQISKNLKQIRKEKGLTLDELAEISRVSKSMLGEIERGGTNPTILILWRIVEGLKIPLTRLMSETDIDYKLVRAAEAKMVSQTGEYSIYSVFPYYDIHKNEILRLDIAPHARLANSGHINGIAEVIFVIKGRVRLTLDIEEFALEEGDAIRFKGDLAHTIANDQDETASLINLLNYE
jgi:XRE family transcriptional regulator, regulator of sulfur utilization